MANEIEVNVSLKVSKSGVNMNRAESFKSTMSGDAMTHSVQVLPLSGGTPAPLELSDDFTLPGNGVAWFIKNISSAHNILIGEATGDAVDMVKVQPGESTVFFSVGQVYAIGSHASTAVSVEYMGIEL